MATIEVESQRIFHVEEKRGWIRGVVDTSFGQVVGWIPRRQLKPVDAAVLREQRELEGKLIGALVGPDPNVGVVSNPMWIGNSLEVSCPQSLGLAIERQGTVTHVGSLRAGRVFYVRPTEGARHGDTGLTEVLHIEGSELTLDEKAGPLAGLVVRKIDLERCATRSTR